MFKVHHVFPSSGEWGSTIVDTLEEAEGWFECKTRSRGVIQSIVTLYDNDENILKQVVLGKSDDQDSGKDSA